MLEGALTGMAVVLALTQPVPQVIRLLRTRTTAGVSAPTAWLGLTINVAWVLYGVARGIPAVALLSAAYVAGYAIIAGILARHGDRRGVGTAIGAAAALAGLTSVAGWVVLGTVLALTVGVQFVPQVLLAWRSEDLTALAPGTYLVCLLDGMVWGVFGVASADGPLILYGVIMVAVAVLVLVPRWRWSRSVALAG